MCVRDIFFNIGEINIFVSFEDIIKFEMDKNWRKFLINKKSKNKSKAVLSLNVNVHIHILPKYSVDKKVFCYPREINIYWDNNIGSYIILFPHFMTIPHCITLKPNFEVIDIYIKTASKTSNDVFRGLLFSSIYFVVSNLLVRNDGLIFHACGVNCAGKGLLFMGNCGCGKSTMASLWQHKNDSIVLSDEMIIVRKIKNRFYMYGTPWCSTAHMASQNQSRLNKIFFINHCSNNIITSKVGVEVITSYIYAQLQRLHTFWNKEGIECTLRLLSEISHNIPCYNLGFVPNDSVIDFVRGL